MILYKKSLKIVDVQIVSRLMVCWQAQVASSTVKR